MALTGTYLEQWVSSIQCKRSINGSQISILFIPGSEFHSRASMLPTTDYIFPHFIALLAFLFFQSVYFGSPADVVDWSGSLRLLAGDFVLNDYSRVLSFCVAVFIEHLSQWEDTECRLRTEFAPFPRLILIGECTSEDLGGITVFDGHSWLFSLACSFCTRVGGTNL